jgi:cobalt-zinc-cadmium efflux system outer membrane protein
MGLNVFGRLAGRLLSRGRAAGALAALASLAFAQPGDTLTWGRVRDHARAHPSLEASKLDARAWETQAGRAGAPSNPRLSVEAENFAGTGPLSGARGLETTARLEQTVELGGKRGLRKEQAQAEGRLARSERALRELELSVQVREAFAEAVRLQERLHLLAQDTLFLAEVVEVARRRARSGGGGVAEEGKLRLSLSRARLEAENTRAERDAAFQRLAWWMNLSEPDFGAVEALDARPLPEWNAVLKSVERHPDLARRNFERELRRASLRAARAQKIPDLDVNAGVRRLNAEGGDWAAVAGVSIPLSVWNRDPGGVQGSELRARASALDAEAARREGTAEAFSLWNGLRNKARELERLREELLPQADQVREASRAAYAQGRFGVLELLDGHKAWFEAHEHHLERVAAYRRDAAKLEALLGADNSLEKE